MFKFIKQSVVVCGVVSGWIIMLSSVLVLLGVITFPWYILYTHGSILVSIGIMIIYRIAVSKDNWEYSVNHFFDDTLLGINRL